VRVTLDGRRQSVKLPFPASALRRIRRDLSGNRVYVLVYANGKSSGKPLAIRKVLVQP
jgi:hypothetical protein